MPGVACQKHGLQEKKPCPECKQEWDEGRIVGGKWTRMRQKVLDRFSNRCAAIDNGERCWIHAPLEVHHIDGNRSNNHWTNHVPLCRPHHRELQGKTDVTFAEPTTPFVI